MVTLPGLDDYTEHELEDARKRSSAFARYETLLAKAPPRHRRRHEAWCRATLATLLQRAQAEDVCAFWSDEADAILREAWSAHGLDQLNAALVVMGKHGARELNLSSDIDLMVVVDPQHALEVERGLRRWQNELQTVGEFGFCFRLDFDLRPGGKMGPLLTTLSQFEDHYWSQGETWERLALVRLRVLTGPESLTKQIEDLARRFSYRKFLDFTLLEDLKAVRAQVHTVGFQRREGALNLKLEVGGIRDIELMVHSLLVLNGGKMPQLQTRSTTKALLGLKAKGLLQANEADTLLESYWALRQIENTVQAKDDRQTHWLEAPTPDVLARLDQVNTIVSGLLGKVSFDAPILPNDQDSWLTEHGFSERARSEIWPALMQATALSHKNDRDERARQHVLFRFIGELGRHTAEDRDLGLSLLLDFTRATRGKATFFAMLLRQPRLIEDLARLFCLSPYLGSILVSRPELLDHFILRVDESWSSDLQTQLQQMNERKLLTEIWSANQFLADHDVNALFDRLTTAADEIADKLLTGINQEFGVALKILKLGKWGGREMGLSSDLDFVFLCEEPLHEQHSRAARRFISRLTDPSKAGRLYEIDLRLRPSGQSGPLMVTTTGLTQFWRERALAWERQAYLRSRRTPDLPDLAILVGRGLQSEELEKLRRIRLKLLKPTAQTEIDLKYAPGGLIDIEFAAQVAVLKAKVECGSSTPEMLDALGWSELIAPYQTLRRWEQALRLATFQKTKVLRRDSEAFTKTARLLGSRLDNAWNDLEQVLKGTDSWLNAHDPRRL